MIQTSRRLPGLLTPCPTCGRQPMHIHVRGKDRHFLECPPCESRTHKHPTLQQAVAEWEQAASTESAIQARAA